MYTTGQRGRGNCSRCRRTRGITSGLRAALVFRCLTHLAENPVGWAMGSKHSPRNPLGKCCFSLKCPCAHTATQGLELTPASLHHRWGQVSARGLVGSPTLPNLQRAQDTPPRELLQRPESSPWGPPSMRQNCPFPGDAVSLLPSPMSSCPRTIVPPGSICALCGMGPDVGSSGWDTKACCHVVSNIYVKEGRVEAPDGQRGSGAGREQNFCETPKIGDSHSCRQRHHSKDGVVAPWARWHMRRSHQTPQTWQEDGDGENHSRCGSSQRVLRKGGEECPRRGAACGTLAPGACAAKAR